jgi:transcriptional regulator of arginine metabolism
MRYFLSLPQGFFLILLKFWNVASLAYPWKKMHISWMQRSVDQTILSLLEKHDILDQDAFLHLLSRHGHELTQSTLSRHLKKLHVQKTDGVYRRVDPPKAALPPFTLAEAPPNLLVLRTQPGFGNALALKLDGSGLAGLVGTLAGDDTVFIAVADPARIRAIGTSIRSFLEGG